MRPLRGITSPPPLALCETLQGWCHWRRGAGAAVGQSHGPALLRAGEEQSSVGADGDLPACAWDGPEQSWAWEVAVGLVEAEDNLVALVSCWLSLLCPRSKAPGQELWQR